jgi:hypothetical protein
MLTCPYAKRMWQMLTQSHRIVANIAHRSTTLSGWWKKIARFRKSKTKKKNSQHFRPTCYGIFGRRETEGYSKIKVALLKGFWCKLEQMWQT